ncbi:MAG: hypothetical protein H0U06_10055 [Solirubrobacterales bacterium]|nr:hypothetical protein [Solirubrobacterales bacterium]
MSDPTNTAALGTRFAEALAAKDAERLGAVLHPEIDFRGLTPNRFWEAHGRAAVLDIVLGSWFEPADELEELIAVEVNSFADREQLRFGFRGRNGDGPFLVEQQAYLADRDGCIGWMRVVCSGMRPPG